MQARRPTFRAAHQPVVACAPLATRTLCRALRDRAVVLCSMRVLTALVRVVRQVISSSVEPTQPARASAASSAVVVPGAILVDTTVAPELAATERAIRCMPGPRRPHCRPHRHPHRHPQRRRCCMRLRRGRRPRQQHTLTNMLCAPALRASPPLMTFCSERYVV